MDAALEAMHTRTYALLRWRINNNHFSESLEQLASYNGADMYKYNILYTIKLIEHVLTPESIKLIKLRTAGKSAIRSPEEPYDN